ncbi:FAD-dependent oxidoreductase [Paracandidimonas soli]|uniref:FAD-dependent oxidoreductase n=1 Tax=Paracandidimonas soli TaxID=1917182 RepID=UPI003340D84F
MPRDSIQALDQKTFDVIVIGGGVNGSSSAHHLAAAGYSVLLVDKGDFASGTSSRSSRILGNGMHYLAGGHSPWDFILRPKRFLTGCRMARSALRSRAQMVSNTSGRLNRVKFAFPIYKDSIYKPWQFDAGMKVLKTLGTGGVDLAYERISSQQAQRHPLLQWLRTPERIASVATFDQFQFNWPERVVIDTIMHAQDLGAAVRNYTSVTGLDRNDAADTWRASIKDMVSGETATVNASLVLNTAGIWIDDVNRKTGQACSRKITGTKGIHIAVRLPPECKGASVTWQNRDNEHMYILPWQDLHYIGPTETIYEGDLDDIHPTEDEIRWVIDEAKYMLPGLPIAREDVVYAWAGVRPWTYSADAPKGLRVRVIHDLAQEGMKGILALTGGPLMSHRAAGKEALEAVEARLRPSLAPKPISYAARKFAAPPDVQRLKLAPDVTILELRHAAQTEQPLTLVDLLFRRVPVGWFGGMDPAIAEEAAPAVADILGWDAEDIAREVQAYKTHLRHFHLVE